MSSGYEKILAALPEEQRGRLGAIKAHAEQLLNHTPRFKFFTLHGSVHLNNLFDILQILREGGILLSAEELFLLSLAICIHDLGMVASLADKEWTDVLEGRREATDPAALEVFIRDTHHELIDAYYQDNLGFLLNLGLSPAQMSQVRDISRCHRKVVLQKQQGMVKYLGALLRVIDELDLGANRAPAAVLKNLREEMDATSIWHWYKHNIVEAWTLQHTVHYLQENSRRTIKFVLAVHPSREESVPYWLREIRRPIFKALDDDGAANIIKDRFGIEIRIENDRGMSGANNLGEWWTELEVAALSSGGRKVVLVVDDEFRKLEDLFLPLQDNYHIEPAHNAKDALVKLASRPTDLVIVDMQVGSGNIWTALETEGFKKTGLKLCMEILERYPKVKIGILTGTKHPLPDLSAIPLQFYLRKPIDSDVLAAHVNKALS